MAAAIREQASKSFEDAARALATVASRTARSIVLSFKYLPGETLGQIEGLITADNLWAIAVVFAGWVIATVVGGPVGVLVNGLLVAWGAYELWESVKSIASGAARWMALCYQAQSESDVDLAAREFAAMLVGGGLIVIQAVVAHRTFPRVRKEILKRTPTPDWLRKEHNAAMRTAKERTAAKPVVETRRIPGSTLEAMATQRGGLAAGKAAGDGVRQYGGVMLAVGGVVTMVAVIGVLAAVKE